ncbi:carbohydrate ABC transporter permease [Streptomyces sp. NBC_00356]|uniref:carbohydrate ABC transporter permease n=1 Tax=Streptomyces sp. NBC_00356 TaxID=2975724 RepID=UPI002E25AF31
MASSTPPPARGDTGRAWGNTAIGLVLMAFMLFPVYWMVNVSFQPGSAATATDWFPSTFDFDGYAAAVRDQGQNLITSLTVALGSVAVSLLIATPAAYVLAHFKLRWAGPVLLGILISQMIPGIVIANALYSAYNQLGLLNSVGGLIVADASHGVPFAILIMLAFMRAIPPSLVEAARVDGAGHTRAFFSIVVPMSRNALITAGLFTFLFAWSDFLFALTLTTTKTVRPVTLGLYQYLGAHVNDWSAVMATATLACIPAVLLLVAAQRYVAAGVAGGSVK